MKEQEILVVAFFFPFCSLPLIYLHLLVSHEVITHQPTGQFKFSLVQR